MNRDGAERPPGDGGEMKVPFFRPDVGDAEIEAVSRVLRSGWLTTGSAVEAFESAVAELTGVEHGVALASCTAALHLALEGLSVRPGDLVLVPTLTFAATAEVVRYVGATPVFVDCDDQRSMDPHALRDTLAAIESGRTVPGLRPPYGTPRAVIPVHFGGRLGPIEVLVDTAREFGLATVEDAAHAFGARLATSRNPSGIAAGAWGAAGCHSFYANKCVTTGEGGMLVTDDDAIAGRARLLSQHGIDRSSRDRRYGAERWRYEVVAPGFKCNLTDIAAAIGLAQLGRAGAKLAERERIAGIYRERLGEIEGVGVPPEEPPGSLATWHLFQIVIEPGRWSIDRDGLVRELQRAGVACSVHYRPLHLQPYYRDRFGTGPGMFPVAERLGETSISLPIFPGLTDAELEHVVRVLGAAAEAYVGRGR